MASDAASADLRGDPRGRERARRLPSLTSGPRVQRRGELRAVREHPGLRLVRRVADLRAGQLGDAARDVRGRVALGARDVPAADERRALVESIGAGAAKMAIKNQIPGELYQKLSRVVRAAFPDAPEGDREAQVEALVHEMWRKWDPKMASHGVPPPPAVAPGSARAVSSGIALVAGADPATYYLAEATHRRATAAPRDAFVGHLPVVKVPAPQTGTATIRTGGGDVLSGDHLVYSVEDVSSKFANALGYQPARVDLITPPRLWGSRFGAVAAFVGYRDPNGPPSFYLLEAGMATGEPKVLFFAKTMDTTIVDWTNYTPTPFSAPDHRYEGKLVVTPQGEPVSLCVKAFRKPKNGNAFERDPYVQVDVSYVKQTGPSELVPAAITAAAALRVAAIADAIGMDPFDPFTGLMADLGLALPWIQKPVHA
jgi:hypothetical protein